MQAGDALRMMRQTGAAGVLIGRGVLGRPWLFAELADVFAGRPPRPPPPLSGERRGVHGLPVPQVNSKILAVLSWQMSCYRPAAVAVRCQIM